MRSVRFQLRPTAFCLGDPIAALFERSISVSLSSRRGRCATNTMKHSRFGPGVQIPVFDPSIDVPARRVPVSMSRLADPLRALFVLDFWPCPAKTHPPYLLASDYLFEHTDQTARQGMMSLLVRNEKTDAQWEKIRLSILTCVSLVSPVKSRLL